MNSSKKIIPIAQAFYKSATRNASSDVLKVTPRYHKIKSKQALFGIDDDVPVYIKGGLADKMLFQLTFGLSIVATGWALKTFYDLVFGKKA